MGYEGLRGRSHAEPQPLMCCGGLRIDDATTFPSDLGEAGGLRSEGLRGRSHAEPQPLMCCGGLRIDDATTIRRIWVKLVGFAVKA